jgi:hypothetical protein
MNNRKEMYLWSTDHIAKDVIKGLVSAIEIPDLLNTTLEAGC